MTPKLKKILIGVFASAAIIIVLGFLVCLVYAIIIGEWKRKTELERAEAEAAKPEVTLLPVEIDIRVEERLLRAKESGVDQETGLSAQYPNGIDMPNDFLRNEIRAHIDPSVREPTIFTFPSVLREILEEGVQEANGVNIFLVQPIFLFNPRHGIPDSTYRQHRNHIAAATVHPWYYERRYVQVDARIRNDNDAERRGANVLIYYIQDFCNHSYFDPSHEHIAQLRMDAYIKEVICTRSRCLPICRRDGVLGPLDRDPFFRLYLPIPAFPGFEALKHSSQYTVAARSIVTLFMYEDDGTPSALLMAACGIKDIHFCLPSEEAYQEFMREMERALVTESEAIRSRRETGFADMEFGNIGYCMTEVDAGVAPQEAEQGAVGGVAVEEAVVQDLEELRVRRLDKAEGEKTKEVSAAMDLQITKADEIEARVRDWMHKQKRKVTEAELLGHVDGIVAALKPSISLHMDEGSINGMVRMRLSFVWHQVQREYDDHDNTEEVPAAPGAEKDDSESESSAQLSSVGIKSSKDNGARK